MIVEIISIIFLIIVHIITMNFIEDNWDELKVGDDDYKLIAKYPFINVIFLVWKIFTNVIKDWCGLYKSIIK